MSHLLYLMMTVHLCLPWKEQLDPPGGFPFSGSTSSTTGLPLPSIIELQQRAHGNVLAET